jgi:hypothetical protein
MGRTSLPQSLVKKCSSGIDDKRKSYEKEIEILALRGLEKADFRKFNRLLLLIVVTGIALK